MCRETMPSSKLVLFAASIGLTLLPPSILAGAEPTSVVATTPPAIPAEGPANVTLRPYYLLPFFPFFWPVPPGHLATAPSPASHPQVPHLPVMPFVIWLPSPPLPAPPAPVVLDHASSQPFSTPALGESAATLIPSAPAPSAEAAKDLQPAAAMPPVTPPQGAIAHELAQNQATTGQPSLAGQPPAKALTDGVTPRRVGRLAPSKRTASSTATVKQAPNAASSKRKLCWKAGRLDVCQ